jgi:ectoine hydroxylase-related dioxygenase (phytanoyl-CoA dioxygenase family)
MDNFSELLEVGFTYFENAVSKSNVEQIKDHLESCDSGDKGKGVDSFVNGSQKILYNPQVEIPNIYTTLIENEKVMDVAAQLLKEPYLLSSVAASASTDSDYGRPHLDGRIPISTPTENTHLHTMWCIDDFNLENGSTFFWPGSHKLGRKPDVETADKLPGATQMVLPKGSVVLFLGSTWHAIAPNFTKIPRWGVTVTYCRWWVKPTFDYTTNSAETFRLSRARSLLGHNSIPPKPGTGKFLTLTD